MKRRDIIADFNELKNDFDNIDPTRVNVYLFPEDKGGGGAIEFIHVFTNSQGKRFYQRPAWFPLVSVWADETKGPFVCKAVGRVIQNPKTDETKNALHVAKCMSLFGPMNYYSEGRQRMSILTDINALSVTVTVESDSYKCYAEGNNWGRTVPIFDNASAAMQALMTVIEEGTGNTVAGKELVDYTGVAEEILLEVGFVEVKDKMGKAPSMWQGSPNKLVLNSDEDYYSSRRTTYRGYNRRAESAKKMAQLVMDKLTLRLS